MYAERISTLIHEVTRSQAEPIKAAAGLITECLAHDGVIQAFGTGHSEAIAMEMAGRAGGLVPTNRLTLKDLVQYGGESPEILTPELERDVTVAHRIYALAPIAPQDVFLVISNSGVNSATVEMARLARERGHPVIAITSVTHSARMRSRHPSGQRLMEVADVVLDNHAPYGDAVLPLEDYAFGAVSTITSALLVQLVVERVVADLSARHIPPPIYLSANMVGGDEHNHALEARFAGRIRRGA